MFDSRDQRSDCHDHQLGDGNDKSGSSVQCGNSASVSKQILETLESRMAETCALHRGDDVCILADVLHATFEAREETLHYAQRHLD